MIIFDSKHVSNNSDELLSWLKKTLKPKHGKPSLIELELCLTPLDEDCYISDHGWIRKAELDLVKEELSERDLTDVSRMEIEYSESKFKDRYNAIYKFT